MELPTPPVRERDNRTPLAIFIDKRFNISYPCNADLSLNIIFKIENGVNQNPTIETLTKIAKALGVGVDDLIR